MASAADSLGLAAKVAFLRRPESYPEPTTAVRVIETHMSWVFVTDERVYKMKKPVRLPFLDFSTLARRGYFCRESVRLNRRLAAPVYLGVVALRQHEDRRLEIGDTGRVVEWLERMRRLPEQRMLDVAISRGTVTVEDLRRCGRVLARFYCALEPAPLTAAELRQRLLDAVDVSERALDDRALGLDRMRLTCAATAQRRFLCRETALLVARVRAGRIVEGHGDLRPEHVCLLDQPVFIDCLEFDRNLRIADVADELSYLAMECDLDGASFVGPALFSTWQEESGDRIPPRLIAFYKSFRALVRARLAVGHLPDYPPETRDDWLRQAAAYLEAAVRQAP